jgi:hypothetical protein
MKTAAVLLTLFASAAAFMPATPRALARTAAPARAPATQLNAVDVEDDVESKIARIGVVGGLGFPILMAPFAGERSGRGRKLHTLRETTDPAQKPESPRNACSCRGCNCTRQNG